MNIGECICIISILFFNECRITFELNPKIDRILRMRKKIFSGKLPDFGKLCIKNEYLARDEFSGTSNGLPSTFGLTKNVAYFLGNDRL
jgi:hypothetical protein